MIKKIINFLNRGHSRTVKAKKNIVLMFLLKGLSILLGLIIIPITINYISPYKYGIWLTLSSLVAWLSFFDIGLSNGLRNKFIEAITAGNTKLARTYVSTTYVILILIIGSICLLVGIACFYIPWSSVLNVPKEMNNELVVVSIIVLINFSFQFILKTITTLFNAIQKPALASFLDTASQILFVLIILMLTKTVEGSLVILAISMGFSSLVVLSIGNIFGFITYLKEYRPSWHYIDFSVSKDIMTLGIKFFFMQIVGIIVYQTNNIIITNILDPIEVTVYNIAYKYMFTISMIFTIILTPFWSSFAEAKELNDYSWMKNVTKKLRLLFLGIILIGGFMLLLSPFIYKLWIPKTVTIPFIITALMFLYHIINTWAGLHTQLLAGLGKIKLQLIFSSICGILNIPVCIILCKYWGLEGLILGNIIIFTMFGSWFGYIQINKLLDNKAKGIWNE